MGEGLRHEEIAARFLDTGAVNFDAVGKFITDAGPELFTRDEGLHGVTFGRFNWLACYWRVEDVARLFGGARGLPGLSEALNLQGEKQ